MSTIGQLERVTQDRVVALFRDELGYRSLGDWTDRSGNSKPCPRSYVHGDRRAVRVPTAPHQ